MSSLDRAIDDLASHNIAVLLRAAEYLEKKDRETEHCYATTMPMMIPTTTMRKRRDSRGTRRTSETNSRVNHNVLEKNRRAHLKHCQEELKAAVPLTVRHTTLGLINGAKARVLSLKEEERMLKQEFDRQLRAGGSLRRRLDQLNRQHQAHSRGLIGGAYRCNGQLGGGYHSLSESSTGSSSSSSTFSSESDEIDVIGCPADCDSASLSSLDDLSLTSDSVARVGLLTLRDHAYQSRDRRTGSLR